MAGILNTEFTPAAQVVHPRYVFTLLETDLYIRRRKPQHIHTAVNTGSTRLKEPIISSSAVCFMFAMATAMVKGNLMKQ